MVGLTKRKVQAGRRDFEGGGGTERTLAQNTEDLQKQLYQHYNKTGHLNVQWRVRTHKRRVGSSPPPPSPHPPNKLAQQHSLTRISLALSAILAFKLYRLWGEQPPASTTLLHASPTTLASFLQTNIVEFLGIFSGLSIAHYIHTPLPLTGGAYVLPWSFYVAALLAALELGVFYQYVGSKPDYVLHIDATLPVGALFFFFVWACDLWMGWSLVGARRGLEAGQRLGGVVGEGARGARAKTE